MTDSDESTVDAEIARPSTTVVEVTRDAITRYAMSTAATSEIHYDVLAARRAGFRDVVAPAYFFFSLGLAMDQVRPRAELSDGGIAIDDPLASSKVVSGETVVEWFGAIVAGDVIEVTRSFVGVEHKRGQSGHFAIYTFRRDYSRHGDLLVRETYARIAR